MKKLVYLSVACAAVLSAAEVTIDTIPVESTIILEDVSGKEIKSADLAEALAKKVPSITLVRRSGIANDIILRGQKKDNINVLIDNGKICGACPNRMDPTTSHIATNNVESVEIIEGPYDVENFGTLSGAVKITTKQPTEELHGDFNLGYGSFDYKRATALVSGGVGAFRFLLSMSGETSGQYEDGNGDNFADQIDNAIARGEVLPAFALQDQYRDMDAYTKITGTAKVFIDITDDQELRFGYMANRSDDILYPNSKMDALYDDSNLYTAEYIIRDIGSISKELNFEYYYSDVEHPMSTYYRQAGTPIETTSALTTEMQGTKIKNLTELTDNLNLTVGLDASIRNWDGSYSRNGIDMVDGAGNIRTSMSNVDTTNLAFFTTLDQQINSINIKYGLRYDDTSITPERTAYAPSSTQQDNDYQALSANIFTTYEATNNLTFFGGAGKASRVPDARELYFVSQAMTIPGTDDLKQTTNYEVDLGMENKYESFHIKTKLFYSILEDYIYFQKGLPANNFKNIDATIYGIEIGGSYYALDNLYADFGIAYQRGEKDEALEGQTNTNLADIPPLKGNVALNYVYYQESTATVEFVAADAWKNYDDDNGEQALAGWGVMNLKVDHKLPYGFAIAAGVDNVFDKTYAVSNTYVDLTLLSIAGSTDVMLMNEPGRYYYVNANYSF